MALSAIETYNKPNFSGREQIFSILIVNAWEALLKSKILKDERNNIKSLYIRTGRYYKRRRNNGPYITIDISEAMRICSLAPAVDENLSSLIAIRNTATHLTVPSARLPLLTFMLGSATLRNYSKLLKEWFGIGLNEYNFYILPLGFSYPFQALSALDLQREPEDVVLIMKDVVATQDKHLDAEGFFFVCELETKLISAKKITIDHDLTARIDQSGETAIVERLTRVTDRYPFTYTEAWNKIKSELAYVKQTTFNTFIADQNVKSDPRYATYNYMNKKSELSGPNRNTPILYNEEFIRFCVDSLQR